MAADLPNELIELLERIVLHGKYGRGGGGEAVRWIYDCVFLSLWGFSLVLCVFGHYRFFVSMSHWNRHGLHYTYDWETFAHERCLSLSHYQHFRRNYNDV